MTKEGGPVSLKGTDSKARRDPKWRVTPNSNRKGDRFGLIVNIQEHLVRGKRAKLGSHLNRVL